MKAGCPDLEHIRMSHERAYIEKLKDQREKLELLRTEYETNQSLLATRNEENASLAKQLKAAQQESQRRQEGMADTIRSMEGYLVHLEAHNNGLFTQLNNEKGMCQATQRSLSQLKQVLTALSSEQTFFEKEIKRSRADLHSIKVQLETVTKQKKELSKRNKQLTEQLQDQQKDKDTLSLEYKRLLNAYKVNQNNSIELNNRLELTGQQHAQTVSELKGRLADLECQNNRVLVTLRYLQQSELQAKEERQGQLAKLKSLLSATQEEAIAAESSFLKRKQGHEQQLKSLKEQLYVNSQQSMYQIDTLSRKLANSEQQVRRVENELKEHKQQHCSTQKQEAEKWQLGLLKQRMGEEEGRELDRINQVMRSLGINRKSCHKY